MVGHATVRRLVMGDDYKRRRATRDRADGGAGRAGDARGRGRAVERPRIRSRQLQRDAELVELSKAAARHGGFYMSHIRDEADRAFEAFSEAIAIGEQAHMPVQISHIKLGTVGVWRKVGRSREDDRGGAKRGVDVTADCYPVRRLALDDHRPRAQQALRRSGQRREKRWTTSAARRT